MDEQCNLDIQYHFLFGLDHTHLLNFEFYVLDLFLELFKPAVQP